MRTLFYALGGGLGHVTRQLAIARKLLPLIGGEGLLLTNSPFADAVEAEVAKCSGLAVRNISATAKKDQVTEIVRGEIAEFQPDLMIVDTFPRGIGGELAEILPAKPRSLKTVLVGRNLPREYVKSYDLLAFARERFDLVIVPGEITVWQSFTGSLKVSPIVLRGMDETLPAKEVAKQLRISPVETCVLVVGCGTTAEIIEQDALVAELATEWLEHWPALRWAIPFSVNTTKLPLAKSRPDLIVQHYPLSELFSAVRALIGGAGYNLVHEAKAAGVPLFAQIQPRIYDDQAARVTDAAGLIQSFENVADLQRKLAHCFDRGPGSLQKGLLANGASEAAALIARLIKTN